MRHPLERNLAGASIISSKVDFSLLMPGPGVGVRASGFSPALALAFSAIEDLTKQQSEP
jgi:hypothetical protein